MIIVKLKYLYWKKKLQLAIHHLCLEICWLRLRRLMKKSDIDELFLPDGEIVTRESLISSSETQ